MITLCNQLLFKYCNYISTLYANGWMNNHIGIQSIYAYPTILLKNIKKY